MKFSIVTPAYDIAKWIPETIESVLSQEGDFTIEYILVIDKSPDTTAEIAKSYKQRLESGTFPIKCKGVVMKILEPEVPEGMYVAINRGFAEATGDIFAWLAGDDIYQQGACKAMQAGFTTFPEIMWLKGITATIGEHSERLRDGVCTLYHRDWLRLGVYGMEAYHVEQDSTFFKPELWKKVAPFPAFYRSAGDYWLWLQMAKYAPLWSINAPISAFRKREGQDSRLNHDRLMAQKHLARPKRPLSAWIPRLFFYPYYHLPESLKPLMESLYKVFFPFRSREYLDFENGKIVKKKMSSFMFH